jgi:hypothetical protein
MAAVPGDSQCPQRILDQSDLGRVNVEASDHPAYDSKGVERERAASRRWHHRRYELP